MGRVPGSKEGSRWDRKRTFPLKRDTRRAILVSQDLHLTLLLRLFPRVLAIIQQEYDCNRDIVTAPFGRGPQGALIPSDLSTWYGARTPNSRLVMYQWPMLWFPYSSALGR